MIIGNQEFLEEGHTYVMGILNVTPDSFSDGGRYNHLDAALKHTEQMIKDGAAIIDVGGESTRPGHEKITDREEIDRVLPVIEKIKQEFSVPVSLDTYKAAVAKEGILAGADLLNDIWGLQYDPALGKIVADSGVAYCLMHNPGAEPYDYRQSGPPQGTGLSGLTGNIQKVCDRLCLRCADRQAPGGNPSDKCRSRADRLYVRACA